MVELSNDKESEHEIGQEVARVYKAWDELERQQDPQFLVADMILTPPSLHYQEDPFTNRSQVLTRLHDLRERLDTTTPTGEFLRAKIRASLTYAGVYGGAVVPFDRYVEETLGVTPKLIGEEVVRAQYTVASDAFLDLGYSLDQSGWGQFFDQAQLMKNEIVTSFTVARDTLVPTLLEALEIDLKPDYERDIVTSFEEVDDYWANWISADTNGFRFRINLHERKRPGWFRGRTEFLAAHEMAGHLIQAYMWKQNIAEGKINPGVGITMIPGVEHWNAEGMADTLAYFIPELYSKLSPEGKFAVEYQHLSNLIWNNIHIWANRQIFDASYLIAYALQHLPNQNAALVSRQIDQIVNNPYHRSYLHAYNDGGYRHWQIAHELSEEQRIALLKDFYTRPMTPTQIERRVVELKIQ